MSGSRTRWLDCSTSRQSEHCRYLTVEEKQAILAEWRDRKKLLMRPSGMLGGRGFVDPEIVPLCDALNRLDGICTLQSCAGHHCDGIDDHVYPGRLWLRLSQHMTHRFEIEVRQLAELPAIDRVGKIYWKDGKETVTIEFKGIEAGLLAESSAVILDFFRKLCD